MASFPLVLRADLASASGLATPSGVVAWWPGDGNANDIASTNQGTAQNGVLFLPGLVGGAFALAGGAVIEVPNSTQLNFSGTQPMTLELWVYRTGTGTAMELVSKRTGALAAAFEMAFDPIAGLHFGSISLPWETSYAMTGVQLPLNQWWHLAGTFDGTELRFYINGELAAAAPGKLGSANSEPLRIGALDDLEAEAFEGLLDEVTLYNRALRPEEIRAIYQAGSDGKIHQPVPPAGKPVAAPPGLVSWWPGDGDAKDAAGSNDGQLRQGATFAPGLVGQAFALTNGAYIEVPNSASLHFSGTHPMTLELWAYRTGTGTTMHLVSKRNRDLDCEYLMVFDPQYGVHFTGIGMPWEPYRAATGIQLPLRQWWHLAGTFDGAQLRFYINGELAASAPGRLGPTNAAPVRIGTIDYNPASPFEGLLDEVSIYNRALNPDEIRAIYQAGAAGKVKPPVTPVVPPVMAPSGLVSWWPGDGDAKDAAGSNDGQPRQGATFAPGLVGQAFALTNGAYIEVPNAPSLNFSGTRPMTLELWAYRTGTGTTMHLVSKRNGVLDCEYLMVFDPQYGVHFTGVGMPWEPYRAATGMQLPLRQWWHLAGTFDGAQLRFYINGELAASAPGKLGPLNSEPVRIGTINYHPASPFEGLLDEVSIYDRALSPEEIRAIYQAGAAGKTKLITVAEAPRSQVGYWGKSARFDVVVSGAGAFAYQWLKDGVALPGATSASLVLTDLRWSDAGSYAVVVSSPGGSAMSVPAELKVYPAGVSLGLYAGLLIEGVAGRTYAIQYTPALSPTNAWITLTNLTLTYPVQLWIDTAADTRAPDRPRRIYQVVPAF